MPALEQRKQTLQTVWVQDQLQAPLGARTMPAPRKPPVAGMETRRPVAIITAFHRISDAYSLCQVVKEQLRAFLDMGHPTMLITCLGFEEQTLDAAIREHPLFLLRPSLRCQHPRSLLILLQSLPNSGLVISHDLLFVAQYEPFAEMFHKFVPPEGMHIYHLSHSTAHTPTRTGGGAFRCSVPRGHRLLALSQIERTNLSRYYQHPIDSIRCLPNHLTPLLSPEALHLAETSGLLQARIASLTAVSMPRAWAKRLDAQVRIMAALGRDSRLLIANAYATSPEGSQQTAELRSLIIQMGVEGRVLLTSDLGADPHEGVPNAVVRELLSACNMFMLPSLAEACPLSLMEAALAGCLLVVE